MNGAVFPQDITRPGIAMAWLAETAGIHNSRLANLPPHRQVCMTEKDKVGVKPLAFLAKDFIRGLGPQVGIEVSCRRGMRQHKRRPPELAPLSHGQMSEIGFFIFLQELMMPRSGR